MKLKLKPLMTKKQNEKYLRRLAERIEFTFLLRVAELLKIKDETPEIREQRLREEYLKQLDISVKGWLDFCDMAGRGYVHQYFSERYGLEKVKDQVEDWIKKCLMSYQFLLIKKTPYRNPDKIKNQPAAEVHNEEKREVPQ